MRLSDIGRMRQGMLALLGLAAALVALGVAGRLLPHPPNFTPVAAVAIFAGLMFRGGLAAWLVPIAAMALSDLMIGFYHPGIMTGVYLGMLMAVLLGRVLLAQGVSVMGVICSALGAGIAFFVISNFAVWLFGALYPPTLDGLIACYVAALPFLKYTLAGNLFWCGVIFGLYAFYLRTAPVCEPIKV